MNRVYFVIKTSTMEHPKVFMFFWNFIPLLKHSACVPYRQEVVSGNLLKGCTYFSLSRRNSTLLVG